MNENDIPANKNNETESTPEEKAAEPKSASPKSGDMHSSAVEGNAAEAPHAEELASEDASTTSIDEPLDEENESSEQPSNVPESAEDEPATTELDEATSTATECQAEQTASASEDSSGVTPLAQAKETVAVYLKKAGHFLGLNKKASALAAAVALCAVVGIGAAVSANTKPQPNGLIPNSAFVQQTAKAAAAKAEAQAGKAAAGFVSQSLTPAALNSIDSFASAPGTFSLVEGEEAAQLSDDQLTALKDAAQGIEGGGYTVGFTLINLNTGKGIAYDLDSRVYGASSFKGPYGAYLCQHLGDADATYPAGAEAAGAGISNSIDSLLQPMIVNSDNNAFSSLRNSYDSSGFAEWLSACGVDSSIMHDTHFPRYSARESALLWLHTYQYLKTGTPTAQHLASLYAQTNVSFIRAGVGSADGVETVRNKAGWCASGARFTGLCDAGLIECADGTTYLMSTMTNAPDGSLYTVRLSNLASALFACRDALD